MESSQSSLHEFIRSYYTERVQNRSSCCSSGSCCTSSEMSSTRLFDDLPLEEQPISFGCGDPLSFAELQTGQVVLDLGSGSGYDCFLASRQVGDSGRVIGVDMTPQMILQASQIAQRLNLSNVEFRLGTLENLPIESNSVDVILSNCVINLTPDKQRVFREAYRVLRPGGKLAITDMVSLREMPATLRENPQAWAACISGAVTKEELTHILTTVGFREIKISLSDSFSSPMETDTHDDVNVQEYLAGDLSRLVVSARIRALK